MSEENMDWFFSILNSQKCCWKCAKAKESAIINKLYCPIKFKIVGYQDVCEFFEKKGGE